MAEPGLDVPSPPFLLGAAKLYEVSLASRLLTEPRSVGEARVERVSLLYHKKKFPLSPCGYSGAQWLQDGYRSRVYALVAVILFGRFGLSVL